MNNQATTNIVYLNSNASSPMCQNCPTSHLCNPAYLDSDDLRKINAISETRANIQRSFTLFKPGDECSFIYQVKSGAIITVKFNDFGDQDITGYYLPGDILGLDGITSKTHSISAITLETSSICEIHFESLENLAMKNYRIMRMLLNIHSVQLRNDESLINTLKKGSAKEKICSLLLSFFQRYKSLGISEINFTIPLEIDDIANILGIRKPIVNEVFSYLEECGAIRKNRNNLSIVNQSLLLNRHEHLTSNIAAFE